jgi:hypothetical protein
MRARRHVGFEATGDEQPSGRVVADPARDVARRAAEAEAADATAALEPEHERLEHGVADEDDVVDDERLPANALVTAIVPSRARCRSCAPGSRPCCGDCDPGTAVSSPRHGTARQPGVAW